MRTKHMLFSFLAATLIALALVTGAIATGVLNSVNPEQVQVPAIVPPLLAPPGETGYIQQTGPVITAPDGRPVAQFGETPTEFVQAVSVNLPQSHAPEDASTVSYAILSSVRYTGGGHTILVTTARPSPAAAQRPTTLGQQTVKLKDGSVSWVTTGLPGAIPNQVVFTRGDLIVTVAGDLPIGTLQDLAAKVIIKSGT